MYFREYRPTNSDENVRKDKFYTPANPKIESINKTKEAKTPYINECSQKIFDKNENKNKLVLQELVSKQINPEIEAINEKFKKQNLLYLSQLHLKKSQT